MHQYDHVGPVEGLDRGSMVCVEPIVSIRERGYSLLVLFHRQGGRPRFSIIDGADSMDIINPFSAVYVGGRLIVSCLDNLIGSHPTVGFITYIKRKGEWKAVRHATTNYRSYRAPILRLSADGKHIQPVRFRCETYPASFESGHVAANVPYTEQWSFPNNRPKRDWRRVNDSPYHAVDLLVRAFKRRNIADIKRRCLDKSISKTLLSHMKGNLSGLSPIRCDWSPKIKEWDSFLVEEWKLVLHYRRWHGRWVVAKLTPYKEEEE
jgi:hypothetical protein